MLGVAFVLDVFCFRVVVYIWCCVVRGVLRIVLCVVCRPCYVWCVCCFFVGCVVCCLFVVVVSVLNVQCCALGMYAAHDGLCGRVSHVALVVGCVCCV